ncbi:dual specificity protein kinase Ttk [Coccinella septempunctata]|uniref:dual specificity protein kinase Ttk n=1 Tax=Coccinella septempunctata TaxID=41139 RepID=UPI001D06B6B5|nr:dual specificity protein kinase Ttk [Coccinella septempunctata]
MNTHTNSNESDDSGKPKKYEFIPLDLDLEMELAMNEPLPEVMPMDEDEELESDIKELANIKEDSEDGASVNNTPITEAATGNILDETLGCYSIETPTKSQVIYTSLPSETSKKIENKRLAEHLNSGIGKLSLYTPVKTGKIETLTLHPKSSLQLASKETNRSETPINHLKINLVPTNNSQRKTGMFRTPIHPPSLIKPREPASTSKIPQRQVETKFSKVVVRGISYVILKLLGRGGSSEVYQCFDLVKKVNRAVKCVNLDTTSRESFLKEIDCLNRLQRFDRIIKLYDYEHLVKEKKLYVVMEMGSADLSQILRDLSSNNKEMSPPYLILFYWMEMLRAVHQIHTDGIIHSDLKPANFLMVDGKLKLIDFGIASSLSNDSTSVIKNVSEGSSNYISPEALNCEYSASDSSPNYGKPKYKISVKSDVWSLGCILYQLVYKKTPFQHITHPMKKLMAIANPSIAIEYPQDYKVPNKFIATIKKCLIFDAKSRATVDELIAEYQHFDV